jgi:hypothetical protein
VALLSALWVWLHRSRSTELLVDSDTAFALAKIRERGNPWSWFGGDWPLENHFYRPISTLVFEADNALYGNWSIGYGWTNAILCALCVLLLFWFLRELTDEPGVSAGATVIFAYWHAWLPGLSDVLRLVVVGVLIAGALRHGFNVRKYLPAALVLLAAANLLVGATPLAGRTLEWVPGRTALTMTVFCLAALAAYARYERQSAVRAQKAEPGPLDPPATRNTQVSAEPRGAGIWGVVAVLAAALALGSYEQAVMLPATLLGVAVAMRWQGYRVRWGWQFPFWALLVGYLFLRQALLPPTPSDYQDQQLRFGPGVFIAIADYIMPTLAAIPSFASSLDSGILLILTPGPWVFALAATRDIVAFIEARRRVILAATGWLLALLAFLPMAWLQPFDHYHYWPAALRSLLVAVLFGIGGRLCVIAWSPPGAQAPPRPDPAPGSLPRP